MDRLFGNLGFKIHFGVYVAVNLLLLAVNLLTTPHLLWFYWPLIGWGIGVAAHGAAVYNSASTKYRMRVAARQATSA
jgi:hypothetical protein